MPSSNRLNLRTVSALFFVVTAVISLTIYPALVQASPEVHQEIQNNQNIDEVLRPKTSVDGGTDSDGFGAEISDEDWETKASAAALTTENFSDVNGAQNEDQYNQDLNDIKTRTGPTAEEIEQQRQYELQQIRVFEEELERQNRLRALDHERLNQQRQRASDASRRYAERAGADGKWTQEELDEYERLATAENIAWEFTAEEAAEMERQNAIRTQVVDDIRRAAANMGGTSEAEIAERAQNANMVDAGTKTWRNATFTGRMVNEVGRDITAQRELGIRANNTMMAAQNYLNRTDITPEQRAAAQQVYDAAHFARGAAADAIGKDTALILLGTASDVAVLGVGRPVSIVAGKVGQGVRSVWNGVFGGTEAAAGTAGAEVGATLGGTTGSTAGRTAGTEVGTTAGTAGRTAGTEAGTAAGTRAAGTEAGATGRAAGEEAGAAGSGKAPSQMTRAERQAHSDARGDADIKGVLSNPARELIDGGTHVLPAPPGAVTQTAAGELSKGLTQAEVNALFQPGANLTSQQIMQKADLLLTGYRPPVIGGPAPAVPGVVAGAADDAATIILPSGQGAVTGAAAEAGTVITRPGAAAGSTTQAFDGAITLPGSTAPGAVTGAAAEAGTVITRPGTVAGSTTQAFDGAITLPGSTAPGTVTGAAAEAGTVITRPGAAAGSTTQAFDGAITLPGSAPSAATGAATQTFNPALTLPSTAPATTGVSSQAGTIITGAGGRGAAEATGATTIIERGASR